MGSTEPKKRLGQPKLLNKYNTQALKQIIQTDRFSPLGDVTNKLNTSLNTILHYNIIRSYFYNKGLGRLLHKKSLV